NGVPATGYGSALGAAAEVPFRLGGQVGEYHVGGGVLRQVLGIDLVQGVAGVVVQVEVGAAVLAQPGPGHAGLGHRDDVRAAAALVFHVLDAQRRQRLGDLPGGLARVVRRAGVESVDASRAEVALGRDQVQADIVCVALRVLARADQALLLVGEGDHADAALRAPLQLADEVAGRHGDAHARGVVDRAGAQVPGVQVRGDHHELVAATTTGDLADHVLRGVFPVEAHVQGQLHGDRAALQQPVELVGVGQRQGGRGDRLHTLGEAGDAGV